ncbi:MAG: cytochrome c oxidase assembly protein [Rhodospirillaceae bacterium]|nr:cytochrome c oxidase assembly protein [Rhodospirillaceae bacterium]MCY4239088.1 cytochrome c oxidase assembly protein [Rhodospirillaceae bacterium]MCY4311010.1 cytochrome c oxidase assembly protein [Rhodospirillaceae bacterium]
MRVDAKTARGKRITVVGVLAILCGMTLLVVYAVPLYEMFCRVTGFGGYTQRATAAPPDAGKRVIAIRFVANISSKLDWQFQPEVDSVKVRVGERRLVAFVAKSREDGDSTGVATFNVTPAKAGVYFSKIACFCFEQQTLKTGEQVTMPVSFFVDPAIVDDRNLRDVDTITLSYTFFRASRTAMTIQDAEFRNVFRN